MYEVYCTTRGHVVQSDGSCSIASGQLTAFDWTVQQNLRNEQAKASVLTALGEAVDLVRSALAQMRKYKSNFRADAQSHKVITLVTHMSVWVRKAIGSVLQCSSSQEYDAARIMRCMNLQKLSKEVSYLVEVVRKYHKTFQQAMKPIQSYTRTVSTFAWTAISTLASTAAWLASTYYKYMWVINLAYGAAAVVSGGLVVSLMSISDLIVSSLAHSYAQGVSLIVKTLGTVVCQLLVSYKATQIVAAIFMLFMPYWDKIEDMVNQLVKRFTDPVKQAKTTTWRYLMAKFLQLKIHQVSHILSTNKAAPDTTLSPKQKKQSKQSKQSKQAERAEQAEHNRRTRVVMLATPILLQIFWPGWSAFIAKGCEYVVGFGGSLVGALPDAMKEFGAFSTDLIEHELEKAQLKANMLIVADIFSKLAHVLTVIDPRNWKVALKHKGKTPDEALRDLATNKPVTVDYTINHLNQSPLDSHIASQASEGPQLAKPTVSKVVYKNDFARTVAENKQKLVLYYTGVATGAAVGGVAGNIASNTLGANGNVVLGSTLGGASLGTSAVKSLVSHPLDNVPIPDTAYTAKYKVIKETVAAWSTRSKTFAGEHTTLLMTGFFMSIACFSWVTLNRTFVKDLMSELDKVDAESAENASNIKLVNIRRRTHGLNQAPTSKANKPTKSKTKAKLSNTAKISKESKSSKSSKKH